MTFTGQFTVWNLVPQSLDHVIQTDQTHGFWTKPSAWEIHKTNSNELHWTHMSESGTRLSYFSSAIEFIVLKDTLESCSVHYPATNSLRTLDANRKMDFSNSFFREENGSLTANSWTVETVQWTILSIAKKHLEMLIYFFQYCTNKETLWTASTGIHECLLVLLSFNKISSISLLLVRLRDRIPLNMISQKCCSMACAIKFVHISFILKSWILTNQISL